LEDSTQVTEDTKPPTRNRNATLGEEAATVTLAKDNESAAKVEVAAIPALVVHSGPNLGDYFAFPENPCELVMGRSREMDFVLRHASVSRSHTKFVVLHTPQGRSVEVTDLGSTNGTQLNGRDLVGCSSLSDGDMIQIGEIALRYRLMDPAEHAFQEDIAKRVESARTDPLTGLLTRRFLVDQLPPLLDAYRRNEEPFSLLIVDLDHFKSVNDRYGHLMGDQVLCSVSACLTTAIRGGDAALRFGGEEFCVVLPGAPSEIAQRVGERIRKMIANLAFEDTGGESFTVTCSIGVAEIHPDENIANWLNRADRALYRAKGAGRNQVEMALEPDEELDPSTLRRPAADQTAPTKGVATISHDDLSSHSEINFKREQGSIAAFAKSFLDKDKATEE